jgi:hypothetical protein
MLGQIVQYEQSEQKKADLILGTFRRFGWAGGMTALV